MNMSYVAQQWTQDEAIAFESACECITDLIGILMAAIYREEDNAQDSQRLAELRAAVSRLWRIREILDIHDQSEIARICDVYGSRIRVWRESVDPQLESDACLRNLMQLVEPGT